MLNSTKPSKVAKRGLSIKSRIKAGGGDWQHNQTAKGLRVKSRIKAGGGKQGCPEDVCMGNHNQTAKGVRVTSRIKAGEVKPAGTGKPG